MWLILGGVLLFFLLSDHDSDDTSHRIRDKSNDDLMRTRHIDNQRIDRANKAAGRPYREDV